jgi:hypothetical protein
MNHAGLLGDIRRVILSLKAGLAGRADKLR